MEGTPICQEQWVNVSSQIPQFLFKKMPLAWVEHHPPKQLPLQTHRQGIRSSASAGNSRAWLSQTDPELLTHSPVLLGHILVVDVPTDVAVRGADALAANVLRALQDTGAM